MNERYYGLDFLKFVSAWGIVCHHYCVINGYSIVPQSDKMYIFVELFFVIAGFLAMMTFKSTNEKSFSDYMIGKISRVCPMAVCSIAVTVVLDVLFLLQKGSWFQEQVTLWNIVTSFLFIGAGGIVGNIFVSINNPVWFISTLLVCYVIFWIVARLAKKWNCSVNYLFLIMMAIGLMAATYDGKTLGVGSAGYLEITGVEIPFMGYKMQRGYYCFFGGALLYNLLKWKEKRKEYIILSLVLMGVYILPHFLGKDNLYEDWQLAIVYMLFCPLVVLSTQLGAWNSFLKYLRVDSWGGISFEIFLWHLPALMVFNLMPITVGCNRVAGIYCIVVFIIAAVLYAKEKSLNDKWRDNLIKFRNSVMDE